MIYSIGDLHFDSSGEKPMDIFGDNWVGHKDKIIMDWKSKVTGDDLVLVPGDISWALKLNEAIPDLELINSLPGKKVFIKGNHDYWWEGISKLKALELDSIEFLRNSSFIYKDIAIAGTRGWISRDSEGFDESDEKIFKRELIRLEFSLGSIETQVDKKIVMLHYPPFNNKLQANEFVEILKEHNVDICIYGHLHAEGHKYSVEGEVCGIDFHLVASDYLDFQLKLILEG